MKTENSHRFGKMWIYLVILALIVRFAAIGTALDWDSDISSSQLIARLIVQGQGISMGHYNSGLGINYPPFFYLTQAIFRIVADNYFSVLAIHILLHLVAGYAIYKIVTLFAPRRFGIFALILYLISPLMISASSSVWQVFFALPLGIIALYPFIETSVTKEIKPYRLFAASLLLAFSTTIAYGVVFELGLVLILVLFFFPGIKLKLFFSVLNIVLSGAFNINAILGNGVLNFIERNLILVTVQNDIFNPSLFVHGIKEVLRYNSFTTLPLISLGILLIGFIVYFLAEKHSSKKRIVFIFMLYLLGGVFLSANLPHAHYGTAQYPFFYILAAIFSSKLLASKQTVARVAGLLFAVYFLLILLPLKSDGQIIEGVQARYLRVEQFMNELLKKVDNPKKTLFLVAVWHEGRIQFFPSTNFWYFHSYINKSAYHLKSPDKNCYISTMEICFDEVPEDIFLICPYPDSELSALFTYFYIDPRTCTEILNKYTKLWGKDKNFIPLEVDEINHIKVDPVKFRQSREIHLMKS